MNTFITPDFGQSPRSIPSDSPKEMLTVQRDGSAVTVKINSSSLSLLQTCARKSMYTLHQGWKSRSGSPALIFGSAVHKALEAFYLHPRKERGELPPNFEEVAQTLAQGYEPPAAHFLYDCLKVFIEAAQPLRNLPDTDKRSVASGTWVMSHYFQTYFHDVYVACHDEQGPIVERGFETVLIDKPNFKVILFGTIDFVLKNEVTGHILPGDHKTSSQMGGDFLSRIKPNHQYTGYLVGSQRVLGLNTEDFLVNGIQVKSRPKKGMNPTFTRQITKRTTQDVAEFTDVIEWYVSQYVQWQDREFWPMGSVDSCSMWGGCGFLEICSAPNNLRQNILESKFECNKS